MCINKRYISNYYGKSVFVPCGHCPACLQSKAIARANRIRNNTSSDGHRMQLFVTLTYRWDAVPYFKYSELTSLPSCNDIIDLPIYRDSVTRYKRVNSSYTTERVAEHRTVQLSTFEVPDQESYKTDKYTWIRKYNGRRYRPLKDKVGVCFLPDFQNFIKRLRRKLEYDGFNLPFKFYYCAEYGPTTQRPHFHSLLDIPSWAFEIFKRAIVHSWPFDACSYTEANIEIARNASSYVSSYVNCSSSVPALLRHVRAFSPRHYYSKNYGMGKKSLSFDEIQKSILSGDCCYDAERIKDHTLIVERVLLPKYALNRYFPKFKGYSKIPDNNLIGVLLSPECLASYAYSLDYTSDDFHKVVTLINHKMSISSRVGLSRYDYAALWVRSWKVRSNKVWHDWYDSINKPSEWSEAYDNIVEYYSGRLRTRFGRVEDSFSEELELNPNLFKDNLTKHVSLYDSYFRYSKDRKVRNLALSSESFST